ncbi:hypothetical protein ABPG74_007048 [Tetrahymena malaccensis]
MQINNRLRSFLKGFQGIQYKHKCCFSNGNLWTSAENPLPESERANYSPYFDFKYGFGQGGKLIMRMNKSNYNLVLHTLWEDYSEVNIFRQNRQTNLGPPAYLIEENGDGGREAFFSDETYNANQIQNELFKVYARIPEYYSYDIEVNGPITHENTQAVSSKIYGDVRAITPFSFKAKKVKTEVCEIKASDIHVDTYLESFRAQVTSDKDIRMKKCAISGYATINLKQQGEISISSLYTNPERRPQNIFCEENPFNFIQLKNKITNMVESTPHITINSNKGNIILGASHGTAKITAQEGNIQIDTLSNQQAVIKTHKGHVKAHIYSIVKDSYIEGDSIELTVEQSFKQNLYLINAGEYFGEQKQDQPTLFVKGQISPDAIQISTSFKSKMPSFMLEK